MKHKFYAIVFRKKIYSSVEALQVDADEWIRRYNVHRPHLAKYCYGKTPLQTFEASKGIAQEKWRLSNDTIGQFRTDSRRCRLTCLSD